MLRAMRSFLRENDMMAYLRMMAVRLVELHRVLEADGLDLPALRPDREPLPEVLMDAVFGAENFRNEIIWKRTHATTTGKRFASSHDTLLFYREVGRSQLQPHYTRRIRRNTSRALQCHG